MKRDIIRIIGILLIIIVFSLFIYPTPFYYTYMSDYHMTVKVNRFTGDAYILNPSSKKWDTAK